MNKNMSLLFKLPHEIILLVIQRLDIQDCFSLLSTCKPFYSLISNDVCWRDLIQRKYNFCYRDATQQTWWQLYASGDAACTCSHVKPFQDLHTKRELIWASFHQLHSLGCCEQMIFDNYAICMEPGCTFIGVIKGCGDIIFEDEALAGHMSLHSKLTGHNVILNLSSLHFMEFWCYACNDSVGFCSVSQIKKTCAETYAARHILQYMTELPPQHHPKRQWAIRRRRTVEQTLSSFQREYDYGYIINRDWFNGWTAFLSYKSNHLPEALDNSSLFKEDSSMLHSHLVIGHDFELVSGFVRAYIERIYGLQNNSYIVSKDDYMNKPIYRGIYHSALLHRHITVAVTRDE